MAEDRPGCQVKYSTWNLVVVGGLAALSLGDTVSALRSSPAHPSLWVLVMLIAVALLWGGCENAIVVLHGCCRGSIFWLRSHRVSLCSQPVIRLQSGWASSGY